MALPNQSPKWFRKLSIAGRSAGPHSSQLTECLHGPGKTMECHGISYERADLLRTDIVVCCIKALGFFSWLSYYVRGVSLLRPLSRPTLCTHSAPVNVIWIWSQNRWFSDLDLVVESTISRCNPELATESSTSRCNPDLIAESTISRCDLDLVVESTISRSNLDLVGESTISRCNPELEYHGIPWNIVEYRGISWNIMGYHRMLWNVMEYRRI